MQAATSPRQKSESTELKPKQTLNPPRANPAWISLLTFFKEWQLSLESLHLKFLFVLCLVTVVAAPV